MDEREWNKMDRRTPKPQEVFLNVDLVRSASAYLKYLDLWRDFVEQENNDQFVRKAIRRYERFWLTLLNQMTGDGEEDFQPPKDVHWIWHLHMLQPASYSIYCKQRFGRILNHRFPRTDAGIHAFKLKTAAAWRKAFPNEPFELDTMEPDVSATFKFPVVTRLDHLIDLASREKFFHHRVEFPHFHDQSFQFAAVSRYRQLLALKRSYDWEPRCLPSDIELIWRVHMLQPLQYLEDINRVLNSRTSSVSPFSEQSFLSSGIIYLECLAPLELSSFITVSNRFWSSVYTHDESLFFVDGTTPRPLNVETVPQSPFYKSLQQCSKRDHERIVEFKNESYESLAIENCNIIFNSICVEDLWSKQKTFKVTANLLGTNSFKQILIFQAKGTIGRLVTEPNKKLRVSGSKDEGFLGACKFDSRENRGIELQVFACHGFGCFVKYRLMTTKVFDPLQNLTSNVQGRGCISFGQNPLNASKKTFISSDNISEKQKIVIPKVTCTDPKVTMNYSVEVSVRRPYQFILDRNPGDSIGLPKYLESHLAKIINWQKVGTDHINGKTFLVSRHSLKCREAGLAFGIEIVRNDHYNVCAVALFHNNQHLVALAYSIDSHYLATSFQVMETCPLTFDQQDGDLAMMVRKHSGEELIIVTKWIEGTNNDNRMLFRTYNIKTQQVHSIEIPEDEQQSFFNDTTSVDLPSGRVTVSASAEKVPECLTWAFCVGCLFISMQRPTTNTSLTSSHSFLGLSNSMTLRSGSIKSRSGQLSSDASTDASSVGKKPRKKISLNKHRLNKRMIKRRKMSASFTFLLACGFRVEIFSAESCNSLCNKMKFLTNFDPKEYYSTSNEGIQLNSDDITGYQSFSTNRNSELFPRKSTNCLSSVDQQRKSRYSEPHSRFAFFNESIFERI